MTFGPVTELDKKNKLTPKKIDDDVIFSIYGQFGVIKKFDSESLVYKTYIFINSNLFLQKLKTKLKNL